LPITRPGISRLYFGSVARKPACGPPKPMGTPNRWAEPTTMSAPHSPGGRSIVSDSMSVLTTTFMPLARAVFARAS